MHGQQSQNHPRCAWILFCSCWRAVRLAAFAKQKERRCCVQARKGRQTCFCCAAGSIRLLMQSLKRSKKATRHPVSVIQNTVQKIVTWVPLATASKIFVPSVPPCSKRGGRKFLQRSLHGGHLMKAWGTRKLFSLLLSPYTPTTLSTTRPTTDHLGSLDYIQNKQEQEQQRHTKYDYYNWLKPLTIKDIRCHHYPPGTLPSLAFIALYYHQQAEPDNWFSNAAQTHTLG